MPQRGMLLHAPLDTASVRKGLERACGKAYDDMGKATAIAARSTEGRFFCELGAFASVHTLRVLHLHLAGVLRSSALVMLEAHVKQVALYLEQYNAPLRSDASSAVAALDPALLKAATRVALWRPAPRFVPLPLFNTS